MKTYRRHAIHIALVGMAALLLLAVASCDSTSANPTPDPTIAVSVPAGESRFVSLGSGTVLESTVSNTTAWDLEITNGRVIYTNSGDTASARASGGTGGVFYVSGANSVGAVTAADLTAATAAFALDTDASWDEHKHFDRTRWVPGHGGGAVARELNVMTYHGWQGGIGDEGNPYSGFPTDSGNAFFDFDHIPPPPTITLTNRVYIVRHGDGQNHTAIQISGMEGTDPRNFQITYRNLD